MTQATQSSHYERHKESETSAFSRTRTSDGIADTYLVTVGPPHQQTSSKTEKTKADGLRLREDSPVIQAPVGDDIRPAGVVCAGKVSGEVVECV